MSKTKESRNPPISWANQSQLSKSQKLLIEKSKKSKMSEDSVMSFNASLLGSSVLDSSSLLDFSTVQGECQIRYSTLAYQARAIGKVFVYDSYLGGNSTVSIEAMVGRSSLFNSSIVTDKAIVTNSLLAERATISGEAIVKDSFIGGAVTVTGNAILQGLILEEEQYLLEGHWKHQPLHLTAKDIQLIFGVEVPLGITEGINDKWTVGCTSFPYGFWVRNLDRLEKALELTENQMNAYFMAVTHLRDIKLRNT